MEEIWQTYKGLMTDGWSGWWLDGVEYLRRRPVDFARHLLCAEEPREVHADEFRDEHDNVWALMRAKAFYEKQRRDFPDQRVYILNRTVFPGVQAYATGVNQGDYWSSWALMRIQTVWLLQMQMSGVMFPETDIGGHWPTGGADRRALHPLGVPRPLLAADALARPQLALPPAVGFWAGERGALRAADPAALGALPLQLHRAAPGARDRHADDARDGPRLSGRPELHERLYDQFMWGDRHAGRAGLREGRDEPQRLSAGRDVGPLLDARGSRAPATVSIDAPLGKDPLFVRARHRHPDARALCDTIPSEVRWPSDCCSSSRATGSGPFASTTTTGRPIAYERAESPRRRFASGRSTPQAHSSFP